MEETVDLITTDCPIHFSRSSRRNRLKNRSLADSTAYCDKVIDSMNDAKGMEIVRLFGPTPRLHVLTFNIAHDYEHYGNLVTYMRLKGIVPPSSEPR